MPGSRRTRWLFRLCGRCGCFAAGLLLVCGLSGCGSDRSAGREEPLSFLEHDSAGIRLSITDGVDARAAIGWVVDSIPDLVIGADPSSAYLYLVQGVRGYADGRTVVVDGGSAEVRFFDPRGRLVSRAGGRGSGPGEFGHQFGYMLTPWPAVVPWPRSDSLLVFDPDLNRLQVFSSDGRNNRTVRFSHSRPSAIIPPVGALDPGTLLLQTRRGISVDGGPAPSVQVDVDGIRQQNREYLWYDVASGTTTVLESIVVDLSYGFGTVSSRRLIPFTAFPSAAVTSDAALITDGRSPEIREYDRKGEIRRIIRVLEPRRPVTSELIQASLEYEIASLEASEAPDGSNLRAQYARMPIPDSLPVFVSLLVDASGWLWARVYPEMHEESEQQPSAQADVRWMIFDLEGRARGIIRTPAGLEIQSIAADFIWGVWRDAQGVEYVRRHRLTRAGTTP